jgi:hypothetical protein
MFALHTKEKPTHESQKSEMGRKRNKKKKAAL